MRKEEAGPCQKFAGVCASHTVSRGGEWRTNPLAPPASWCLCWDKPPAPLSIDAPRQMTRSIMSGVTRPHRVVNGYIGRPLEIAESPSRTESALVLPPSTTCRGFLKCQRRDCRRNTSTSSAGSRASSTGPTDFFQKQRGTTKRSVYVLKEGTACECVRQNAVLFARDDDRSGSRMAVVLLRFVKIIRPADVGAELTITSTFLPTRRGPSSTTTIVPSSDPCHSAERAPGQPPSGRPSREAGPRSRSSSRLRGSPSDRRSERRHAPASRSPRRAEPGTRCHRRRRSC